MENVEEERKENEKGAFVPTVKCICTNTRFDEQKEKELDPLKLHIMLRDKELELREEFEKKMEKETGYLKDRFNFILQ